MPTFSATSLKPLSAFAIAAICLWVLGHQLSDIRWADLRIAFTAITGWQWAIAAVATLCSFLAIGQYDVLWHRHLKTGVATGQARRTGMAAVAVAQTVGIGTVTGTFLRWHMLNPLPLRTAAAVTIGVGLSFLICWAGLAIGAAMTIGVVPVTFGIAVLTVMACTLFLIARRKKLGHHLRPAPHLFAMATLDLAFAGIALWVLLPDPNLALLPVVVGALVLAQGAGLISNAPGGIGAFELVMLALVTMMPEATVLAAILGFRVIYYLIPALCGAGVMLAAHLRGPLKDQQISTAPISDLVFQGARLTDTPKGPVLTRRHLMGAIGLEADHFTTACIAHYKCSARAAAQARKAGWTVRQIASDAVIPVRQWTTAGKSRSQLRRKLRQAEKADVTITRTTGPLPLPQVDAIAARWAQAHGGELGYAMGRYSHDYIGRQAVYLIYAKGRLCGFITVQTRAQDWAIDLIRHEAHMPPGAMHLAMAQIVEDARKSGALHLSLGAVPDGPSDSRITRYCQDQKAGLRQFKASFDPIWHPCYHAAPNAVLGLLTLTLITWHIQRPVSRTYFIVTNLINITRIIHLIHNNARDTPPQHSDTEGAYCDGRSTLEPAG